MLTEPMREVLTNVFFESYEVYKRAIDDIKGRNLIVKEVEGAYVKNPFIEIAQSEAKIMRKTALILDLFPRTRKRRD